MSRWQSLAKDIGSDPVLRNLSAAQVAAVVDVLALSIYADGDVSPIEVAGFNMLVFDLPWAKGHAETIQQHVADAVGRIRASAGDEAQRRAMAEAAAAGLGGAALRENVFRMAAILANVDFELEPAEVDTLAWLAEVFGIDRARAQAMVDELRAP
jgi:tellurite resistance protein